ncbi:hypothetical protein ACFSSA_13960 [Luteolibacter algae]|uniref:Uncharacterized protein n=1 Tax=Luteolibacter algae TaxID=454151 RepID=A0ABW5D9M3_9BACT
MSSFEHPTSLNVFQRFRQACEIHRESSRASQAAWYQNALELDMQLHISVDGTRIESFFYNRSKNEWSDGPAINDELFVDPEQISVFAAQLQKYVRASKGNSVGVVLHIADEFATAELKQSLDNPAALSELRETAYHNPGEILDDSSVPPDQGSWRVLPYPAAGSEVIATTISLTRSLEFFTVGLRNYGNDHNFPIITQALSAPLIAIMGLPSIIDFGGEKPVVAIMQYPWFTAMAFFNEHGDLRLLRALQHRGLRRPSNFRHAVLATNAALEFVDPDIHILPLGDEIDPKLVEDLQKSFPESMVKLTSYPVVEPLPSWLPEPMLAVQSPPDEVPESMSQTFKMLLVERWPHQDFLPALREAAEVFPTRNEMRLVKYLKHGRVALFCLTLLSIIWLGFSVATMIRRPEWTFNADEARSMQMRMGTLNKQRQTLDHWNNLLEDRSKAWSSMEAIARLFPAKSGLLVKGVDHTVRPDSAPGQKKIGFVKEWVVTGMVRDEALAYLNSLNTREGISAHFSEIAKVTGNLAYDPTPVTRTLVINVKTKENPQFHQMPAEDIFDGDESTYPFSFTLTITQRFESGDVMAVSAVKAP